MKQIFSFVSLSLAVTFLLSACTATATQQSDVTQITDDERSLTVMTHDSFSVSEEVLQAFKEQSGIEVRFLKAGDTGTAVNKAILAKEKPLADVFYGVDNTFLSRALEEGIFEPYNSPILADISDNFIIDKELVLTGSFNISNSATENNDENMVIIRDSDLAAQYLAEFERIQSQATTPPADQITCP